MMKTKTILLVTILCIFSISFCQSQNSDSQNNEITTFIENTIEEIGIPGVAVAVIKDDQVVYKNYLGKGNLEYNIPIKESSLFRLHSLSKVFVSVGIFQLIDQKKISLDDKISKYLSDLPDEWEDVRIENLLSHSSGLPDMRDEINPDEEIAMQAVYDKEIQFPIGERANYNQTNFWLLNRIISKVTAGSFQNYIVDQFSEESGACFSSVLDIIPNRVMEYKPDYKGHLKNFHFVVQKYMYGAAGMTMTLDDLIEWDKKLNTNVLIKEESKNKMLSAFKYEKGKGFSHGWDIQYLNGIVSYGFNGAGLVNYRKFPSKNISVIWFTNGYTIPYNLDNVTNRIAGFIDTDLIDRTPQFIQSLENSIGSKNPEEIKEAYYVLKNEYPNVNFENAINSLGYSLLRSDKLDAAIKVFKLNTEEFPESANTFDSLGEGFYVNKQFELSKENYQKSLDLDPSNMNAREMILKMEEEK